MSNESPKLHNAMWPGLIGKGGDQKGAEPTIGFDKMLELTAHANANDVKFDGIDLFLFPPHVATDASNDALKAMADKVAAKNLKIGSLAAPVWPEAGGDTAMGSDEQQTKFLKAVETSCHIANVFNEHGVREYGVLRIDSAELGVKKWRKDPKAGTARIADTFKKAGKIAADHGERLAVAGEICWAGLHTCNDVLELMQRVDMPDTVGFQADLAHTYLYLIGRNATENPPLKQGYTDAQFWSAYQRMLDKLRPWTIDFHIAQSDGEVIGTGAKPDAGKHCLADDPNGKLDIVKCAELWMQDAEERGIEHICWDGSTLPNATLENPETWNGSLAKMIEVRDACGW